MLRGIEDSHSHFGLEVSDPCHSFGEDAHEARKIFTVYPLLSTNQECFPSLRIVGASFMKTVFLLSMMLMILPLSGCMTGAVIREARDGARTYEVKDPETGETTSRPAHPKANYLLLPITITADIITAPVQGLIILLLWGTC